MFVLFDLTHILYMVISTVLTVVGLVLVARFCKTQARKDLVLKITAISTLVLHYSDLWVDYLKEGSSWVGSNHLFPMFPCNLMMWVLVAVAFIKKRENVAAKITMESLFWIGTICGFMGILLNANYDNSDGLRDWTILKGLLSHSTMLFGCIYMVVGKYIRVSALNAFSCLVGFALMVVNGLLLNGLFIVCGQEPMDGMMLTEPLLESVPWLSIWWVGPLAVLLLFGSLALYECCRFPKEERWYNVCKKRLQERKEKTL